MQEAKKNVCPSLDQEKNIYDKPQGELASFYGDNRV